MPHIYLCVYINICICTLYVYKHVSYIAGICKYRCIYAYTYLYMYLYIYKHICKFALIHMFSGSLPYSLKLLSN